MSRSQASEVKPRERAETTEKAVKASTREERRESATVKSANTSKTAARRNSQGSSFATRMRNNKAGRFVYDAYYELRYKVTWPTFEEARNMTVLVVIISAVLGALLSLVDFGLYHLFILVIGGK
ncbi:preprotein translocase subunit SecE [Dictyobacter alpinus]|uniref:preprotein translocase subunit SecE n=1 Tax=Dictyobacter alpinus TaxID=2014873 RepID=UPI001C3F5FEB|nr:preprotein translocase subunit SecE [Dictyobacter alpinus]